MHFTRDARVAAGPVGGDAVRRRRPTDESAPLWVVIAVFAVFGAAMFLAGYVVCHSFA